MKIHEIVNTHIVAERDTSNWPERHKGKLAVSEIGHCPRKALLRVHGIEPTDPYDVDLRRLMWSGKMAENKLEVALQTKYGDGLQTQIHVENAVFVGTVDFLTPDDVVEHKETATSNFWYKRLPYDFHLFQVLAYRELLDNELLEAILYYQNRGDWAEFRVWEVSGQILYEGHINNEYRGGDVATTLEREMKSLTFWYEQDKVPPRMETPFEKNFYCTRMYSANAYPSCTYWTHCWGNTEYAGMEKIAIPEEYKE